MAAKGSTYLGIVKPATTVPTQERLREQMKKTFNIRKFIEQVNERNKVSTCEPDIRQGWNFVAEHILHEAGVYSGYRYLTSRDVPEGFRPGINMDPATNMPHEDHKARFEGTDETRINFYIHSYLQK